MANEQRYVSNELSHFVGKGQTEESQYDLLVNKILKAGLLAVPPQLTELGFDISKPITDEMMKSQVVCFCDIPEPDLRIHVSKYSKFGLAFEKRFLIPKGACPVFYVANEGPVSRIYYPDHSLDRVQKAQTAGTEDRAQYFDKCVRALIDICAAFDTFWPEDKRMFHGPEVEGSKRRFAELFGLSEAQVTMLGAAIKGNEPFFNSTTKITEFLMKHIVAFIKCFDANRPFDDASNYYMEREWRIANNVQFDLADVSRVFFPRAYAARFRADLPAYLKQITFLD